MKLLAAIIALTVWFLTERVLNLPSSGVALIVVLRELTRK